MLQDLIRENVCQQLWGFRAVDLKCTRMSRLNCFSIWQANAKLGTRKDINKIVRVR